jgi:predicted nucleic acid-binding protein
VIAYADTGFLVSLYGEDVNSAASTALVASKPVFLLTPLIEVEFVNALELRVFRKEWSSRDARLVHQRFLEHQAAGLFRIELLRPEVWDRAIALSRRRGAVLGTRTLDLLHVAAALVLRADVLFSFDARQRSLAKSENLRVLPS